MRASISRNKPDMLFDDHIDLQNCLQMKLIYQLRRIQLGIETQQSLLEGLSHLRCRQLLLSNEKK